MTRFNVISTAFCALLVAAIAAPNAAHARAGVTACLSAKTDDITIVDQVIGAENGVVIIGNEAGKAKPNDTPVFAGDNYFGHGAGAYWKSALPATLSLPQGCYTFFFMTKTAVPGGTQWLCNHVNIGNGGIGANGAKTTTLSGQLGAGATSGFILVPAVMVPPTFESNITQCPKAYP